MQKVWSFCPNCAAHIGFPYETKIPHEPVVVDTEYQLRKDTLSNAPFEVIMGLDGKSAQCGNCGHKCKVVVDVWTEVKVKKCRHQ